jgi:hypothetical protein
MDAYDAQNNLIYINSLDQCGSTMGIYILFMKTPEGHKSLVSTSGIKS